MGNTKPAESAELKLEVGKAYRTRDGERVDIRHTTGHDLYAFQGSNDHTYTVSGTIWSVGTDKEDLIGPWYDEFPPSHEPAPRPMSERPELVEALKTPAKPLNIRAVEPDAELAAIETVIRAIQALDHPQRVRVLDYVTTRNQVGAI